MRFTIGIQIMVACMVVVMVLMVMNVFTYYRMKTVEHGYDVIIKNDAALVAEVKDLAIELKSQSHHFQGFILTGTVDHKGRYHVSRQSMQNIFTSLNDQLISPEDKQRLKELQSVIAEYHQVIDQGIEVYGIKGLGEAAIFLPLANQKVEIADKQMERFVDYFSNTMNEHMKVNDSIVTQTHMIIIFSNLAIFLLSIGITFYFSRRISRPIGVVSSAAKRIADGDLSYKEIRYSGNDEIGDLIKAFAVMAENLRTIVNHVTKAAEQVSASSQALMISAEESTQGAERVATAAASMVEGTGNQVVAIDNAVSMVHKMAGVIARIFMSASEVSQQSQTTSESAMTGNGAMADASAQMQMINGSVGRSAEMLQRLGVGSQQIGEIVDVITGIASQTNLLALNAAIEAARAGEQGRGFAVVADEVRKLAEQSQGAARKIAVIVKEIQTDTTVAIDVMNQGMAEVGRGTEVINDTGKRFQHIASLLENLNSEISEISRDVEEMSISGQQVFESVESVKTVAGNNVVNTETISAASEEQSAGMHEISAATTEMARMAENLQNIVGGFKL